MLIEGGHVHDGTGIVCVDKVLLALGHIRVRLGQTLLVNLEGIGFNELDHITGYLLDCQSGYPLTGTGVIENR